MKVEVELWAFGKGQIREVDIPESRLVPGLSIQEKLELVFEYGQNDFQPKPLPSVSVDDVVRLDGKRWRVARMGFEEVV